MALTHREEKILEAVIDGSSVPFDPVTRREKIFAKAAGEDIELAPPITKEEQILSALAAKGSGGGGSSDFSTAEVTIASSEEGGISVEYSLPQIPPVGMFPVECAIGDAVLALGTEYTVTVVLYKGKCCFRWYDTENSPIVSGNATYDSENSIVIITGDCKLKGRSLN